MRFLIFSLLFIFCLNSQAEYRAFRLLITTRAPAAATPPVAPPTEAPSSGREIISTLDPDQYRGYYQVKDNEDITYTQTWMCPGRTANFKDICPAPATVPVASSEAP